MKVIINKNIKSTTWICILSFFTLNLLGQRIEKSTKGSFLLKNGIIHTITNGTITGDALLQNEKIIDIGQDIKASGSYTIIDCSGKHIYPGMIDSGTQLGLSEIEAVSITNDVSEIGDFIPQMQALTAVNPNAVAIPVTRFNGVTTVLASPKVADFQAQLH